MDSTLRRLIIGFLFAHFLIFVYINTRPILWQQSEMTYHHFFWSLDDINSFNLHSGFTPRDWLKPFPAIKILEGDFRTRHLSSYLEMVFFKIQQFFVPATFRNFFLIFIHIVNVVLLGILVYYLTKNVLSSFVSAVLLLNSGAALATLLFPFRSAKLLAMTFFLTAWIIAASSKDDFLKGNSCAPSFFFVTILLGLFTDELFFFLLPFLLFAVALSAGRTTLTNRRMVIGLSLCGISYCLIAFIFIFVTGQMGFETSLALYKRQLTPYAQYGTQFSTITDTLRAFAGYFLRRNFGYWDLSAWGLTAFAAFGVLLFLCFRSRPPLFVKRIALAIFAIIGLKAIFLPNPSGYHQFIMPEGTKFPSLLFFSWYYVYLEAVLLSLLPALFLNDILYDKRKFVLIMGLIAVISFSNVYHLKDGPADALAFHGWDKNTGNDRGKAAEDILNIKKILKESRDKIVYLSFPSGDDKIYRMYIMNQPNFYASVIPVMYLRSLEDAEAIISLENVKRPIVIEEGEELSSSEIIYDVVKRKVFDFGIIKQKMGQDALNPSIFKGTIGQRIIHLARNQGLREIVFFIKGRGAFQLKVNERVVEGGQLFGQSYQMFDFTFEGMNLSRSISIELNAAPLKDNTIYLAGPFVFAE